MPVEAPHELRPSLEGVLRAIDERGTSVVVHVETTAGLGQFSVSRGVLRGAAFGDTSGIVALDHLLDAEVVEVDVHEVTDPPPAMDEKGAPLPDHGPRVSDLLDARKASAKGRSGFFATMQSAGQDESTAPTEDRASHSPTLSEQLADVPAVSFSSTQMAGSFASADLEAQLKAQLEAQAVDPLNQTALSGSPQESSPEHLLSTIALAPNELDAPVPSRSFEADVLEELGDLNQAIQSSREPRLPSSKPEPTQRSDAPLPIVGRYEVLARIRSGAAGSVYLCRLSGTSGFRRLFAMKVLRTKTPNPDLVKEFFREARVLENLHHPNVIGIVDTGTEQEPYLVLDYVEGGSLYDLCRASQEARDPAAIVTIVLDALEGISAVHQATNDAGEPLDIVHHDLTPHNLLVGLDGACRVADFGVARGGPTAPGTLQYGKPGYIAPERYLGMPGDRRSDVFSLGVVLYTALSGVEPFAAETDEGARQKVLAGKLVSPSTVGLRPPPSLDWVCLKALAPSPRARFQTAEEMLVALRKIAAKEDLLGSPSDVAEWVQSAMGEQLEARRESILRPTMPPPEANQTPSEAPPPPPMEVAGAPLGKWSRPPSSYVEKTVALPSQPANTVTERNLGLEQPAGLPHKKDNTVRIAVVLVVVALAILFLLPKWVDFEPKTKGPERVPDASEAPAKHKNPEVVIPEITPAQK